MNDDAFKLRVVDALARIETEQSNHKEWSKEEKARTDAVEEDVEQLKTDVAVAQKKTALLATLITSVGAGAVALFKS